MCIRDRKNASPPPRPPPRPPSRTLRSPRPGSSASTRSRVIDLNTKNDEDLGAIAETGSRNSRDLSTIGETGSLKWNKNPDKVRNILADMGKLSFELEDERAKEEEERLKSQAIGGLVFKPPTDEPTGEMLESVTRAIVAEAAAAVDKEPCQMIVEVHKETKEVLREIPVEPVDLAVEPGPELDLVATAAAAVAAAAGLDHSPECGLSLIHISSPRD